MSDEAPYDWPRGPDGRPWVRIMCDACAEGVWNHDGESCAAADLPMPPDLLARLRAWQASYDAAELDDDQAFDWAAFTAEGCSIAQAVKAALPDWTVIYFDEARLRAGRRPCEVEVT